MEDILKFLLVIGFLVIGFVKQAKKEKASHEEGEGDVLPMPDDACNAPIPPSPSTVQEPIQPTVRPAQQKKKKSAHTPIVTPPTLTPTSPKTEEESDYNLHSIEEIRRAVIWSEILQRKY